MNRVFVELLQNKGLNCYQLSLKTGISKSMLYAFKNGEKDLGAENLAKVADALGVSVDYLLGRETKAKPATISDDGRYREMISLLRQIPEDRLPEAMEILRVIVGKRKQKEQ